MTHQLITKLPSEIVDIIKLYTGEGCWRNGKYINIHRIPKTDDRYLMLKKRRIIQVKNENISDTLRGMAWFKNDCGKFMVINSGYMKYWNGTHFIEGYLWELRYNGKVTTHRLP